MKLEMGSMSADMDKLARTRNRSQTLAFHSILTLAEYIFWHQRRDRNAAIDQEQSSVIFFSFPGSLEGSQKNHSTLQISQQSAALHSLSLKDRGATLYPVAQWLQSRAQRRETGESLSVLCKNHNKTVL